MYEKFSAKILQIPSRQTTSTDPNGRIKQISLHSGLSAFPKLEKHLHSWDIG